MPRSRRFIPPNSLLHVVNRGNDRRALFHGAAEYEEFLDLMRHSQRQEPLRLIAYVLMPNHWHLVAWPEANGHLSRYLQRLCTAHAARWRWRAARVGEGSVYQGRFHAFIIESEAQYFNVMRYVEGNPLRAGLVATASEWRWSSLADRQSHARRLVTDGPVPLPADWPRLVDQGLHPDLVNELRRRTRRQQRAAWEPDRAAWR